MKTLELDDPIIPLKNHPMALIQFVCETYNADMTDILKDTKIKLDFLDYSNTELISYAQYSQLISNSIKFSQQPNLGLYFGHHLGISSHGLVGMGALSCSTFWQGMQVAISYKRAVSSVTEAKLSSNPEGTMRYMSIEPNYDAGELWPFFIETLYAVFSYCYKFLSGKKKSGIKYYFDYPAPSSLLEHEKFLFGELFFSANRNELSCPAEELEQPLPLANPATAAETVQAMEKTLSELQHKLGFLEIVRNSIQNESSQFMSLESLASKLHFSPTTLKRKLASHNTHFQKVLDNLKKKLAIDYLTKQNYTVIQTAEKLGYSDHTNFRRAFKKWTGKTPNEFKQSHLR